MTTLGILLLLFGVGAGIGALAYPVVAPGTTTLNMGLLSERQMLMQAAMLAFFFGLLFMGLGQMHETLKKLVRQQDKERAETPHENHPAQTSGN
jgi:hypothetical protein